MRKIMQIFWFILGVFSLLVLVATMWPIVGLILGKYTEEEVYPILLGVPVIMIGMIGVRICIYEFILLSD